MHLQSLGPEKAPTVVWAHGWARTGSDFYNVADALSTRYRHHLLDLPGHGQTPKPEQAWDTKDYSDAAADFISSLDCGPVIWVGHSFGCRVGLRLAVHHPDLVTGMVLAAAAGLKRERSGLQHLAYLYRSQSYKVLKALTPASKQAALRQRYGSSDYLNAGEMRDIFLKTIAEDQSGDLPKITCPVRLFFGSKDTETPVEMGQRMADLIPNARLTILNGMTHWDILARGSAQMTKAIVDMIEADMIAEAR